MATTKSNYSLLHAVRDVMKRKQYGDEDYCSTSIGCRNKASDETVLVEILASRTCQQVKEITAAYKQGTHIRHIPHSNSPTGSWHAENENVCVRFRV